MLDDFKKTLWATADKLRDACRILQVRRESPLDSEDQWPAYYAWLEQAAMRMSEVFRPLVKELN